MSGIASAHLVVAPVVVPLAAAALMVALRERRRAERAVVSVLSSAACLAVAIALAVTVDRDGATGVYLPSNWPAPFGIALVADRLSTMMLVLTSALGLASSVYATARWQRAGVHFQPLFQVQLMGIHGAFLTADLFNLFVFFEVMLAASYGLLLHGSGPRRLRAGFHYLAINLIGSTLFLVGVAMLYGVTGTLNFADMAVKFGAIPAPDRGLLHAGAAILSLAFLVKAAMWPLGFWLVPAYSSASAPAAATFAVMTKVGIYALLRMGSLFFVDADGNVDRFLAGTLLAGGLATLAFGTLGLVASHKLARVASFAIVASSGTLLAAAGFGLPALTAGALFYLVLSTVAAATLFLLAEPVEQTAVPEPTGEEEGALPLLPFGLERRELTADVNLDDDERALVGRVFPATAVFVGLAFVASALMVAGLPPLSGFLAKVAMLAAILAPAEGAAGVPAPAWAFVALVILSGLAAALSLVRSGIRHLWAPTGRPAPRLRLVEGAPIAILLAAGVAAVVAAAPAMRYAGDTAASLHDARGYVGAVMSARVVAREGS